MANHQDYIRHQCLTKIQRKPLFRKKRDFKKTSKTILAVTSVILVIFISVRHFIMNDNLNSSLSRPKSSHQSRNYIPPTPEARWRYIKDLENSEVFTPTPSEQIIRKKISSQDIVPRETQKPLQKTKSDLQGYQMELNKILDNDKIQARINTKSNQTQELSSPDNQYHRKEMSISTNQNELPIKRNMGLENKDLNRADIATNQQRWVVQCGSFHNTEQAEAIRAQLALAGIESHISADSGWNRVTIGPYNSREAVDDTLNRLNNIGMPNCIAYMVGG